MINERILRTALVQTGQFLFHKLAFVTKVRKRLAALLLSGLGRYKSAECYPDSRLVRVFFCLNDLG